MTNAEIIGWTMLLVVFLIGVAVGAFAWHRSGRHTSTYTITSRPMTPAERERFNAAFRRMDEAFDALRDVFD